MSSEVTGAAKRWLAEVPGGSLTDGYEEQWSRFDEQVKPVITVFGSYDTGKSSLIRRLLVDLGTQVPDWLTISARHETFEVREIELANCVLRDTPGLAVGADDVRGQANTQSAKSAIGLTDIAIVTVTPQLATGEHDVLRELIDSRWSTGSLWFAISRFDEAGRDPDSDLDGYRELANRKVLELRESLGLNAATPMFVVAQDPFQFAGADRDVESDIWDDSRGWDGMDRLAAAIEQVGSADWSSLRAATEERFWSQAVSSVVTDLRDVLAQLEGASVEARDVSVRKLQWVDTLSNLDSAAQSKLKGSLSQSIRRVLVNPESTQEQIVDAIQSALGEWYEEFGRGVNLLLQEVGKSAERKHSEPSWLRLEALVANARSESEAVEDPEITRLAPLLSQYGPTIVKSVAEFDRYIRKRPGYTAGQAKPKSKTSTGWSASDTAKVAAMVVSAMTAIAKLVDDFRAKRAIRKQEARALADRLEADATAVAIEEWTKAVSGARDAIDVAMGAEAEAADGLAASIEALRAAIDGSPGLDR